MFFHFIFAVQRVQGLAFTAETASQPIYRAALGWSCWPVTEGQTHVLSKRRDGACQPKNLVFQLTPANARMILTYILSNSPQAAKRAPGGLFRAKCPLLVSDVLLSHGLTPQYHRRSGA